MRLPRSLSCAAAFTLAACGQGADPLPPSGATALAWCTRTVVGTLANCAILQASQPGTASWFLEGLRTQRFERETDGTPVEVSMLLHITVHRSGGEPAR
jgi:hypothetical protein